MSTPMWVLFLFVSLVAVSALCGWYFDHVRLKRSVTEFEELTKFLLHRESTLPSSSPEDRIKYLEEKRRQIEQDLAPISATSYEVNGVPVKWEDLPEEAKQAFREVENDPADDIKK